MKVALITAGHVRLGRAISERLASAGYHLGILYRSSRDAALEAAEQIRQTHGVEVELVAGDLADSDQATQACQQVVDHFGGLDVLVHCASTFYPTRSLQSAVAAWDDVMQVNLKSPFEMSVQCAPALAQRQGSIVNLIDIYATRPLAGYLPYSVAKAGLAALTRSLAIELAPKVRVNGVSPGAILLPPGGPLDADKALHLASLAPLQRVGDPTDIAEAVYYLATAPYVTGQILAVDGGRSIGW